MNKKVKDTLIVIGVVVFVVVAGLWLLLDSPEHIEDTNGTEDLSLQTITQEQIISMSTGAVGGPKISRDGLSGNAVQFSAEQFSGVYEILYDNYILPSDFALDLTGYEISGGNFQLVVVHEEQIVAVLEPDLFVNYRLEDVTGYVSLRIVGESASFSFSMNKTDYDLHSHQ